MSARATIAVLVAAFVAVSGCEARGGTMQKSDIDGGISAIFAASEAEESGAALAFANELRENDVPFTVTLAEPNRTQPLTIAEYLAAEQRLAIVIVQGEVYVWRPKDPKSVDMFFLE